MHMYSIKIVTEKNGKKSIKTLFESERTPSMIERVYKIEEIFTADNVIENLSDYFSDHNCVFTEYINNEIVFIMNFSALATQIITTSQQNAKSYLISQLLLVADWEYTSRFDFECAQRILNQFKSR